MLLTKLPQPHEGVLGTDRTQDDLLDCDPASLVRRSMMMDLMKTLVKNVLEGAHTNEVATETYERMTKPLIGELAVVSVSLYAPSSDADSRAYGFGILVAKRREWTCSDEQWEARCAGEPDLSQSERTADVAHYIQYGPNAVDVCRWIETPVYAVPMDLRD